MCGMLQPVRGVPSIQAHSVSGISCFLQISSRQFTSCSLNSFHLTAELLGGLVSEKEIRTPEKLVFPHSAEGNKSLWETGGKIKMLEFVALESFSLSPVSHPASQAI